MSTNYKECGWWNKSCSKLECLIFGMLLIREKRGTLTQSDSIHAKLFVWSLKLLFYCSHSSYSHTHIHNSEWFKVRYLKRGRCLEVIRNQKWHSHRSCQVCFFTFVLIYVLYFADIKFFLTFSGSQARPVIRDNSEWHLEGIYGSQHIHLPSWAFHEADRWYLLLHFTGVSSSQEHWTKLFSSRAALTVILSKAER